MPGPHTLTGSTAPSIARVYDFLAGGCDWHDADRQLAERITDPREGYPGLRRLIADNRGFQNRAATWALAGGIRQVLDIGCGLPSPASVTATARAYDPPARVACVDIDPLVVCHAGAAAAGDPGVTVLAGDVREPEAILADPALLEAIDLREPVCAVLGAILHFMDAGQAADVTARLTARLAPGSCAVISTVWYAEPEMAARITRCYTAAKLRNHDRAAVASFFTAAGLELVSERVMNVHSWPMAASGVTRDAMMLGGVGIKRLAARSRASAPRRSSLPGS